MNGMNRGQPRARAAEGGARQRSIRWLSFAGKAAAYSVPIALAIAVIAGPRETLITSYQAWLRRQEANALLRREWSQVISPGARLTTEAHETRLVEFSDYECPACRAVHKTLKNVLAQKVGVGVVFRHFPLSAHPMAEEAARAAICAERQGKFAEMNDLLFESTSWMGGTDWSREATDAGVPDLARFRLCLHSSETYERLSMDVTMARRLSIRATPTFVTRRGIRSGVSDPEMLARMLTVP